MEVSLSSIQKDILCINTWVAGLQRFNFIIKQIEAIQFTSADYASVNTKSNILFTPQQTSEVSDVLKYSLISTSYNMITQNLSMQSIQGLSPQSFTSLTPASKTGGVSQGVYDLIQYINSAQPKINTLTSSSAYKDLISATQMISNLSTTQGTPDFSQLIILYNNCESIGTLATTNMQVFYSLMCDLIPLCKFLSTKSSFSLLNDYIYAASIIPIATPSK